MISMSASPPPGRCSSHLAHAPCRIARSPLGSRRYATSRIKHVAKGELVLAPQFGCRARFHHLSQHQSVEAAFDAVVPTSDLAHRSRTRT